MGNLDNITSIPDKQMEKKLEGLLKEELELGIGEVVNQILALDISILTKYLFLFASYNKIEETIEGLLPEQKKEVLLELKKIDTNMKKGRVWADFLITRKCEEA